MGSLMILEILILVLVIIFAICLIVHFAKRGKNTEEDFEYEEPLGSVPEKKRKAGKAKKSSEKSSSGDGTGVADQDPYSKAEDDALKAFEELELMRAEQAKARRLQEEEEDSDSDYAGDEEE